MSSSESDFLFSTMKPMAIFAISVVGFILVFRNKSKRRPLDFYTNPDWNFFMKKWWAQKVIRKQIKAEQATFMKDLKQDEIESPRPLETENSSDSQMIFGQDALGNSLLIKITRRLHRTAEVWLVLRLQDGREFTLPDHPDTQVYNVNTDTFNAGGLSMECLVPFRSWRIRFNGMLRQSVRSEWTEDVKDEELVPVKFNFFWQVRAKPMYWPFDWSVQLMADTLATEAWRDGNWMRLLSNVDFWGYDQYGAMSGEVFVNGEEKESFEINLPGLRQRRWGLAKVVNLRRKGVIIGVCRDGMVFNLGALSSTDGLTHGQFGNVIFSSGKVAAIDWTDFHLRDFGEHCTLKDAQTIRFSVGKQTFTVVIHVKQKSKVPLFSGRPLEWQNDCYQLEVTVNGEDGKGIGMISYPYEGLETALHPHIPQYKRVNYSSVKPKTNKFIYHFSDEDASSVAISGGKGASLALLTSISCMKSIVDRFYVNGKLFKDVKPNAKQTCPEFIVPSGFVLSVSAMDAMVNTSSALDRSIDKLAQLCSEGVDFAEQCELVRKEIVNLHLSDEIRKDVAAALKEISDEVTRIAVRSSSVCEDGEDVSAAGQNETFLGLRSEEDVMTAIKHCWASLYSFQSVHYRKQNLQPIRTGMAVVVQTMLAADCAGVLFSQNPISGDAKQCLISANYGLGESVVSGEVDPDNFMVNRSYGDDMFTIVEKVRGQKGYKIQMTGENNVEKVEVEGEEFCVSDEVVLKLAEIAVVLEKLYGNGRDIEWGLKENRIYLLQSRPITSLNQFTDWELIHENDSAIMSEEDLCTTANVQEVVPGAICPLSRDILVKFLEKGIIEQIEGKHPENEENFSRCITVARHHVFMDVFQLFFQGNEKKITMDKRISSISVCGYDLITDELHLKALKRYPPDPEAKKRMTKGILSSAWNAKKMLKRSNAVAKSFNCQYSDQNCVHFETSKDVFMNLVSKLPLLAESCDLHCRTSSVSTFYTMIPMMIMAQGQTELSQDHHEDIRLICSSAKDTVSADVPKKLEILAKGIFVSGKKEQFCSIAPEDGPKWLEKNIPEMYSAFQSFIEVNKHRCYKEFDMSNTTWGMQPGLVIDMLQAILKFTEDVDSLGKTNVVNSMTPTELVSKLKNKPSSVAAVILRNMIGRSQKAVQNREQTKSNLISVNHEFRLGFRYLGLMMTKEGYLPQQDLIFFLNVQEIEQLFKSRDVHLIKKAMRRQKLLQELNKDRYPDLMWGRPYPTNAKKAVHFESGTEIRGTSVYSGLVTGRACVIHEFSEVSKIQPGDILITYSTDIGWSPYFPILGGVVTEIGGLISHGAVVAREYGLPCVVAATNATDFFTFGETITLDAKNGVIFKGTGN